MDDTTDLALFFKALSDDTRLRLVALLARQERGRAACVSRLAHELDTSISNVSQHLRVLKNLGLVRGERRGYRIHYFLDRERLAGYGALAAPLLGAEFTAGTERGIAQEVSDGGDCRTPGCTRTGNRKDPNQCSPEQIRQCHGESAQGRPCPGATPTG